MCFKRVSTGVRSFAPRLTDVYGTLLAFLLFATPPAPAAEPTPPPEQDPAPEPEPTPFPELPRRATRNLPDVAMVPSLGLGGTWGEDGHDRRIIGTHLYFGVNLHPAPSHFGPFMGVGLSLDSVSFREASSVKTETWYGSVEMRYGLAWLVEPNKYFGAMFPGLAVYAIGGWRPDPDTSSGLYRAGGGISSAMLLAYSAAETCIPVPSMLEVVADAPDGKFSGGRSRTSIRAGWQF